MIINSLVNLISPLQDEKSFSKPFLFAVFVDFIFSDVFFFRGSGADCLYH